MAQSWYFCCSEVVHSLCHGFLLTLICKKHISSWVSLDDFLFLNWGRDSSPECSSKSTNGKHGTLPRRLLCNRTGPAVLRKFPVAMKQLCPPWTALLSTSLHPLCGAHSGQIVDWKLLECIDLPCASSLAGIALCIQKSKVRRKFGSNQEVRFRLQT